MFKHYKRNIHYFFQGSFFEVFNSNIRAIKLKKCLTNGLFASSKKNHNELEIEFANIRV